MMLAVGLLNVAFIVLRYVLLILTISRKKNETASLYLALDVPELTL